MKKIIKALLVVMVIAMAVMVFAACEKDPCKDGHTLEAIGEKLATCTEDGYSSGVVCSVCGYEQRRSFVLEAKGHDMAKATCDKPATCKTCGHTEGEALGHDMQEVAEKAATCTEAGYSAHTICSRCGKTEGKEDYKALGHKLENDKCTVCNVWNPSHVNALVVGKTNKIIVNGETKNLTSLPVEWVEFVVTVKDVYTFTGDTYALIYSEKDSTYISAYIANGSAELEPGTYYILIGGVAEGVFNITVSHASACADNDADAACDICGKYLLPEVGTAFKLKMVQANKGQTLYFTGEMNGYYFKTSEDVAEAVDLYLEAAEDGGYHIYFLDGETRNYIYIASSQSNGKTYINIKFGETKAVWNLHEASGALVTVLDETTYYMGTYGENVTVSVSKISYITGDNASKVDVSQFIARAVVIPAAAEDAE